MALICTVTSCDVRADYELTSFPSYSLGCVLTIVLE